MYSSQLNISYHEGDDMFVFTFLSYGTRLLSLCIQHFYNSQINNYFKSHLFILSIPKLFFNFHNCSCLFKFELQTIYYTDLKSIIHMFRFCFKLFCLYIFYFHLKFYRITLFVFNHLTKRQSDQILHISSNEDPFQQVST